VTAEVDTSHVRGITDTTRIVSACVVVTGPTMHVIAMSFQFGGHVSSQRRRAASSVALRVAASIAPRATSATRG
jgi:hypothetical protein